MSDLTEGAEGGQDWQPMSLNANAVDGAPTETHRPTVGMNPNGPEQQAVVAQTIDPVEKEERAEAFTEANLTAAADVARALPQQPASVNPATVPTAPGEPLPMELPPAEPAPTEPTPDAPQEG